MFVSGEQTPFRQRVGIFVRLRYASQLNIEIMSYSTASALMRFFFFFFFFLKLLILLIFAANLH